MLSSMPLDSYFDEQDAHADEIDTAARGHLASLCEAALDRALSARLGGKGTFTAVELHIHYMRAVPAAAGPVRCVTEGVRVGGRTATAIARVLGASGIVYAHASMTCLLPYEPPIDRAPREGSTR